MDERAKKHIKTIRSRVSARARPDIQFDKHCDGSKPAGHAFEPVCWLRSVSSTQANCPSPEPSKPTHSLKNRGAASTSVSAADVRDAAEKTQEGDAHARHAARRRMDY